MNHTHYRNYISLLHLHKGDTCCSKSSMVTSSQQIIRDLRLMIRSIILQF